MEVIIEMDPSGYCYSNRNSEKFMMASSDLSYPPEGLEEPFHSFIYVPIDTLRELFEPNVTILRSRETRLNYLRYLDFMYEKDTQKPTLTTPLPRKVSLKDNCIDPRLIMKDLGFQAVKYSKKPTSEVTPKKPRYEMMRVQKYGATDWVSNQKAPKHSKPLLGFFKTQLAPHVLADANPRPQTVTPEASPKLSKKRSISHLEDKLKKGSFKKPKSEPFPEKAD